MKHFDRCRLLSAVALALVLCGCGAVEHRAGPAPFEASAQRATPVRPADQTAPASASTVANAKPVRDVRPADSLLNLNLHLYGFSYHPDRAEVRRRRLDNELNAGLGLSYEFHNDDRGAAFLAAGFYRDSGRNWAKLAGPGYQFKFGDRWRLGGALLAIESRTYNSGRPFVAPIPLLTYDLGRVKLNAIYAPRYRQNNSFAAFGFYLSIPLGK